MNIENGIKSRDMEKISRRKVLFGLAAAGAGLAVAGTTNAKTTDLRAQEQRLREVLRHVEIANDHFKRVAARWVGPPDISVAVFDGLLININTECQSVMDTARELLDLRGA